MVDRSCVRTGGYRFDHNFVRLSKEKIQGWIGHSCHSSDNNSSRQMHHISFAPLTAILGEVEVALRRDRSIEEYKQGLDTVRQRTIHLSRMVESLLFLARANAEVQIPSLEQIDLAIWLPQTSCI